MGKYLNEPYVKVLNELIEEQIGHDSQISVKSNDDEVIHFLYTSKNGTKAYIGVGDGGVIHTKDGYFTLNGFKFKSLDMFREYGTQLISKVCKPYIMELYMQNCISELPSKMVKPEINVDLSKITSVWLTNTFKNVTNEVSNGDYIEDVLIENSKDGIKATFKVWWNRWGDFLTDKRRYSLSINDKGKIHCNLPEALEGSDIEDELEVKITELIKS